MADAGRAARLADYAVHRVACALGRTATYCTCGLGGLLASEELERPLIATILDGANVVAQFGEMDRDALDRFQAAALMLRRLRAVRCG